MAKDNSGPETTIVNVKSMPVEAWNLARASANRRDETMAEWLTRAIYLLAQHDAEGRITQIGPESNPAGNPAKPPSLSPEDVEALARAMRLATEGAGVPIPKASARHVVALATQHMRAARGMVAPRPRRRTRPVLSLEADNPAIPQDKPEAEIG